LPALVDGLARNPENCGSFRRECYCDPHNAMSTRGIRLAAAVVAGLLLLAYANHFRNGFHFDDGHTIVENAAIRHIGNIPAYFADARTFSVLPLNQTYRPILQTTLALDYYLGHGLEPIAFQIDSFVWYVLLLIAAFAMLRPIAKNDWVALIAVGIFALHPVCAETVNYVIQRGEIMSTLFIVASMWIFIRWPGWRSRGIYLIPFVLGVMTKPPVLVFPLLLLVYLRLFEPRERALRAIAPALVVAAVAGWWVAHKNPATMVTGAASPRLYWLTQPFVTLRYFVSFFAPTGLSADNDWRLVTGPADPKVLLGVGFVAALVWAIRRSARDEQTRPIAFGLAWFLLMLLPTAITPLAEVANDHRMFAPFIGLSLASVTAAALLLERAPAAVGNRSVVTAILCAVLAIEAVGVHARNAVWRDDETLWKDVTEKSPGNARGWMNYGVTVMARGDYRDAIAAFERGAFLNPTYFLLHVNLGVVYGAVQRPADAEREFLQAIAIDPNDWRSHVYFARWLAQNGRTAEALAHAQIALELNSADEQAMALATSLVGKSNTPDFFLSRSLAEYQMGRYTASIESARKALALKPDYAEAYNNVAAGYNALHKWDEGIAAAAEALRFNPNLAIARNNLAYALQQKRLRKP
jgi:tetratricopeptide (TPR) repeat protein